MSDDIVVRGVRVEHELRGFLERKRVRVSDPALGLVVAGTERGDRRSGGVRGGGGGPRSLLQWEEARGLDG